MTRQPPTPRLQIALDTLDLPTALGPLQQAAPYVDVIECGTLLVLCEGFHAVRAIRALFPDKQILADVRIAEAGSKIARLAFEAGADLVSCVAGASMSTIRQVCQVADELGGEVQVELAEIDQRGKLSLHAVLTDEQLAAEAEGEASRKASREGGSRREAKDEDGEQPRRERRPRRRRMRSAESSEEE